MKKGGKNGVCRLNGGTTKGLLNKWETIGVREDKGDEKVSIKKVE